MLQRIKMAIRKNIEDKGDNTNPNYFDPTRNVDIKHFQLNELESFNQMCFNCNCCSNILCPINWSNLYTLANSALMASNKQYVPAFN